MTEFSYPKFPTQSGYMTQSAQHNYITWAVAHNVLPKDAHRMADIISLNAPNDPNKPIQFWQLYSVLGQDPIVTIVADFYRRVFADEDWFTSVFARVGDMHHHINTQASMWIDVMGGGPYYHGADFRLNFHHTHNAHQLMNAEGAAHWANLMLDSLEACASVIADDPRVRPAINTFLTYFMGKYAEDFAFAHTSVFGPTNPAIKQKINFLRMSEDRIKALTESELREGLSDIGIDVSKYPDKVALVNKALMV